MPSTPQALLEAHGLHPRISLGQNFLFDDNILHSLVVAAEVTPADQVLEIGPGLGSLTHHLARSAQRVVAVELDERLIPVLHQQLAAYPQVEIIHGDILTQDLARLFPSAPYKVVANVPYYITAAILRHLLASAARPAVMVLTVQKEVAERLTATPGNLSLLAVSVQFYGRPTLVGVIKAGAFWPRPEVDSAIVKIDLRGQTPPFDDEALFFRLVRAGFSQKRKQLKNNLRGLGLTPPQLAAVLIEAGVDGRRRAETVALVEWARLAASVRTYLPAGPR